MKVKIKSLPSSHPNNKAVANDIFHPGYGGESSTTPSVKRTLQPVDDDEPKNVEAEKGEIVIADMNFDGIPESFIVGGKKHSQGGTDLNLPPDSFIFSDTSKMKIKDRDILDRFNMGKGSFTPADIAKKYNINKYREMLYDKDIDKIQADTAEAMIKNYNLKLGELAIVQESKKGFPTGIPVLAMPYLEANGIDPSQFLMAEEEQSPQYMKFGGPIKAQQGGTYGSNATEDFLFSMFDKGEEAWNWYKDTNFIPDDMNWFPDNAQANFKASMQAIGSALSPGVGAYGNNPFMSSVTESEQSSDYSVGPYGSNIMPGNRVGDLIGLSPNSPMYKMIYKDKANPDVNLKVNPSNGKLKLPEKKAVKDSIPATKQDTVDYTQIYNF